MDRYSFLHGTRADGTLTAFGGSQGRVRFFDQLGATDPTALQRLIQQILNGTASLPGYENEPADMKPVTVRYVPMHLYRKKETANIKQFCAMNIAGYEHRTDRISNYDHTIVLSTEEMCNGKQFSHVDHLFGTKLTDWQEIMRFRNKEAGFDYDRLPDKVNPEMKQSDIALCIRCVQAIYAGQNVVIRIEKGHNFNHRSREILMQIYSLLQPKLAVEVGFAAYQAPEKITSLANELSMRIFVIPAGCSLTDTTFPANFVVMDLAERTTAIKLEHSPLVDTLIKWLSYNWEKRLAAYRAIFADVVDYQNAEVFVQRSEEFFEADKKLSQWKASVQKGSVSDLDQLRGVYEQHIEKSIVPWANHEFTIRVPGMLAAGNTIGGMLTDAAVGISTNSGEAQKKASERYLFGKQFGNIEIAKLSRDLLQYQAKVSDVKWQAAMDEAKQKAAETLAAANAEAAAALAQEQERTKTAQAETLQAKADGEKNVAEERKKAAEVLAAAKAEAATALAQEQERTKAAQEETLQAKAEGEKQLALVQKKAADAMAAVKAEAATALAEEKTRAEEARNELVSQHTKEMNVEKKRYVDFQKKSAEAYASMQTRAEKAETDLAASQAEVASSKKKFDEEITRMQGLLKVNPDDLRKMKKENAKLKRNLWIGIVAGVLAGALVCGGVLFLLGLVGSQETDVPPTVPPVADMATEPTVTEPVQETEPVPTTAPTEATEPVVEMVVEPENWESEAFVQGVMAAVPGLKTVRTEAAAAWLPEASALGNGYDVVAVLSGNEMLPDVPGEAEEYMLLLKQAEVEAAELSPEEQAALEEAMAEAAVAADEGAAFDIAAEAGATMALAWDDQLLVVYGGNDSQAIALQVADYCAQNEKSVDLHVNQIGQMRDVFVVMTALLGEDWASSVKMVTTDNATMEEYAAAHQVQQVPAMVISGAAGEVFLFNSSADVSALVGGSVVDLGNGFAVLFA